MKTGQPEGQGLWNGPGLGSDTHLIFFFFFFKLKFLFLDVDQLVG